MKTIRCIQLLGIAIAIIAQSAACRAQEPTRHEPGSTAPANTMQTAPAAAPTMLDMSITELQQTEFFTFFHWEKIQEGADPAHQGMKMTVFGTSGSFKGYVNLIVGTAAVGDKVNHVALMMRRDFIDNPKLAPFARDIAKSFLALAPDDASQAVAKLREEIGQGCNAGSTAYGADEHGKLSEKRCGQGASPSGSYLAYLGKNEKVKIEGAGRYVMLQNSTQIAGVPMLFVEMGLQ